jgi:nitrate/nitrite transporter NarK
VVGRILIRIQRRVVEHNLRETRLGKDCSPNLPDGGLPWFLNAHYGLTLAGMGVPLLIVYNVCTVGSVVGIGACCGSLATMFFGLLVGFILQITKGNYAPVFFLAGTAYLVAILLIQILAPRLEVARLDS